MSVSPYVTLYPEVPAHLRITEWLMNRDWRGGLYNRRETVVPSGWSETDVEQLGELRGTMPVREIGKRMGRTHQAVRWAIAKLYPDMIPYGGRGRTWRDKWDDTGHAASE